MPKRRPTCARIMHGRLKKPTLKQAIRRWAAYGPAYKAHNPLTQRPDFYGSQVNRTAPASFSACRRSVSSRVNKCEPEAASRSR